MKHAITLLANQAQKELKAQENHINSCSYYEKLLALKHREMQQAIKAHQREIAAIETDLQTEYDSAVQSREILADCQQALQAIAKETV